MVSEYFFYTSSVYLFELLLILIQGFSVRIFVLMLILASDFVCPVRKAMLLNSCVGYTYNFANLGMSMLCLLPLKLPR